MTATAFRPRTLEDALREETDLAEIGAEYAEAVAELVGAARAEARAAGAQYRLLHRLWLLAEEAREQRWAVEAAWLREGADRLGPSSLEPEEQTLRDVADEIGPALHLPAVTALGRVRDAVLLGQALPEVLESLEAGRIGVRQAGVVVDLWRELVEDALDLPAALRPPVEQVRRIAAELLQRAPEATAAQLRALARRRRAGLLRETEEARHRAAHRDRRVWVEPLEDGMAQLCAVLDAAGAHAIADRIDLLAARSDAVEPADPADAAHADGRTVPERRTVAQRRADVLVDLLLEGEPARWPDRLRGVRGQVTVTVPALALLEQAEGVADGPFPAPGCALLEGHGPIPVSLAEQVAAGAPSWSRVLTHPLTGVVLDHDRTTYAVPADLKRRLRVRDGTCRFPGCRRAAARCDLDHTQAWADGGTTAAGNLAHLCRHHHLLKHREGPLGRWHVVQRSSGGAAGYRAEGVLEWTSPAGRTHRTDPQEH